MKIKIDSVQLNNYLTYKLDKLEEEYTLEELESVNELVIDDQEIDIQVLKYFKNLEILELRNIKIDEVTMNIILSLKKLFSLSFELCKIEKPYIIKELDLKELHLHCCNINEYDFIYEMINLEKLTLTGEENLNIDKLNKLTNLKYLNISHTKCSNDVINIESLEELYIDNSNVKDIEFVLYLDNLKVLSLSKEQYENKQELINKIKNKNIEIYDYSIMLLGDI